MLNIHSNGSFSTCLWPDNVKRNTPIPLISMCANLSYGKTEVRIVKLRVGIYSY